MKKYVVSLAVGCCLCLPVLACGEAGVPTSFEEKISYSMGYEVGSYFMKTGGDIQEEYLVAGIKAAFQGADPALTPEQMLAIKKEFAEKMQAKQIAMLEDMKKKNSEEGAAYLEANKAKEGVVVTGSGLQYTVLKEGSGEKAKPTDMVKVEYTGTLTSGKEFDSSAKHGGPATFRVDQVIPGWSEALQLMSVGTKLHLVIPAALAYGENGAAPNIEPNSVLLFDVELMSIEAAK